MDFTEQSPVILSLCTGMRGLERGIERACERIGWKQPTTTAYVEIEAFLAWNLVKQMEQGVLVPTPVWTNLKTFPYDKFHGKIHGIIGGYPCQPFSIAGQRKGTEDPRHLWPYIKEGIRAINPVFCFFENVPGHLSLGYREVRSDLEELGYSVKEGIFSASEVGAPHQRKRLFILAIKLGDTECEGLERNSVVEESKITSKRCKQLANFSELNVQGRESECSNKKEWSESGKRQVGSQGLGNRWPSKPGEEQQDWEAPRTESRMGFNASRNKIGDSDVYLNLYEIYTTKKIGAIKELHELWLTINSESQKWTFGRLFDILKEKILFSGMLQGVQNSRLSFLADSKKWSEILKVQEIELRNMWFSKIAEHPSLRQKCIEQLRIEFADAMCILSYQITLARRQEKECLTQSEMQSMWNHYENTWWDVPETLSEIQKIWRPISDQKESEKQFIRAYTGYGLTAFGRINGYNFREDLLRMAGNGVVEQTAELAFITLLNKFNHP